MQQLPLRILARTAHRTSRAGPGRAVRRLQRRRRLRRPRRQTTRHPTTTTRAPELSAEEQAELETAPSSPNACGTTASRASPTRRSTRTASCWSVPHGKATETMERGPRGLPAHLRGGRASTVEETGAAAAWDKVVPGGDCGVCRRQRVRLLGAPGRSDQGRVLPRRRRHLYRRHDCAFTGMYRGGEANVRLEHLGRGSGRGGRDLRLRPNRQPVPRLQLHLRADLHR